MTSTAASTANDTSICRAPPESTSSGPSPTASFPNQTSWSATPTVVKSATTPAPVSWSAPSAPKAYTKNVSQARASVLAPRISCVCPIPNQICTMLASLQIPMLFSYPPKSPRKSTEKRKLRLLKSERCLLKSGFIYWKECCTLTTPAAGADTAGPDSLQNSIVLFWEKTLCVKSILKLL